MSVARRRDKANTRTLEASTKGARRTSSATPAETRRAIAVTAHRRNAAASAAPIRAPCSFTPKSFIPAAEAQ